MLNEKELLGSDFDLRAVSAVLRRQSRVIIYTFVLIFGLAGLFLITVTPKFTATALIVVDPDTKSLLEPGSTSSGSASANNSRIDSEVEILRSSAVALAVVRDRELFVDPEFRPDLKISEKVARAIGIAHAADASPERLSAKTLAKFKDAISVHRMGLTYLISVAVSSQSEEKAADLANVVSKTYIDQQVQAKISASLAARDILQSQIQSAQQSLFDYETRIDDFIDVNMVRLLENSTGSGLAESDRALDPIRTRIGDIRNIESQIERSLEEQDWGLMGQILDDQSIADLENKRQHLIDDLTLAHQSAEQKQIESALGALDDTVQQKSTSAILSLRQEARALQGNAAEIRKNRQAALYSSDLPTDLLAEIYGIQQKSNIAKDHYQILLSRLRDLEIQAGIQIADSRIASPALAPISPTFPNKNLVLLVALAASAGIGFSLAFMNEYYVGGITSAPQLSELLQVPTAASIPLSNETNAGRLSVAEKVIDAPLSTYAESVRTLRAAIDQSFRSQTNENGVAAGKIVLFTSSLASEGKTTTALALARTYALAGMKTLLIDADLRRPSLHKHLGFSPEVGFLDYLRSPEKTELSKSFYARDPASPLALIMGSARSEFATDQLLNTPTFEGLVKQARDVYDITIIDSPPLLPVVDARYIARHVDAVVLMVKWAATSQSDLRAATQPLRAAMAPNATLLPVLGQSQERHRPSGYEDYYEDHSAAI